MIVSYRTVAKIRNKYNVSVNLLIKKLLVCVRIVKKVTIYCMHLNNNLRKKREGDEKTTNEIHAKTFC